MNTTTTNTLTISTLTNEQLKAAYSNRLVKPLKALATDLKISLTQLIETVANNAYRAKSKLDKTSIIINAETRTEFNALIKTAFAGLIFDIETVSKNTIARAIISATKIDLYKTDTKNTKAYQAHASMADFLKSIQASIIDTMSKPQFMIDEQMARAAERKALNAATAAAAKNNKDIVKDETADMDAFLNSLPTLENTNNAVA